jgi:hypothetical protein
MARTRIPEGLSAKSSLAGCFGWPQELCDPSRQPFGGFNLALPDRQDSPTGTDELGVYLFVSGNVPRKLGFPETASRLRRISETAIVAVPKASVNKNDCRSSAEHDVRSARQCSYVNSVAIAKLVKNSSDEQFWFSISAFYARHQCRAGFL